MSCIRTTRSPGGTELSRALFRAAVSALSCDEALLRGDGETALLDLEDFRATLRYLEHLCRQNTVEAEELCASGCLGSIQRAEQRLIEACRGLLSAAGAQRCGVEEPL